MINELKHMDLKLYSYKLENGLNIYIVPKKDSQTKYVTFTTKFGSSILSFKPAGSDNYIDVNPGIAHFLEHKVFENKDGQDPFAFYTNHGADTNANTSYDKTTYLFSGPVNFNKNLKYLLKFVQTPYFTDANVEKEKGIIKQEINLYADMPFWKLYDSTLYNVFVNHPMKHSVAGTYDDISGITKEKLYDCYNTFYNPSNMFLVITGNVNPDKTFELIKKDQEKKVFSKITKIDVRKMDEPDKVAKEKEIIKFNVQIPKLAYALKINIKDYNINELNLYLNTLFDIKFGPTSVINEQLKKDKLITEKIDYEVLFSDKHIVYMFLVETPKPEYIADLLDKELSNITITKEDLERKKKLLKSIAQYRSDNVFDINHKIVSNIIKYNKVILDDYKIIDEMNINKANDILNNLDFNHKSITIMKK